MTEKQYEIDHRKGWNMEAKRLSELRETYSRELLILWINQDRPTETDYLELMDKPETHIDYLKAAKNFEDLLEENWFWGYVNVRNLALMKQVFGIWDQDSEVYEFVEMISPRLTLLKAFIAESDDLIGREDEETVDQVDQDTDADDWGDAGFSVVDGEDLDHDQTQSIELSYQWVVDNVYVIEFNRNITRKLESILRRNANWTASPSLSDFIEKL